MVADASWEGRGSLVAPYFFEVEEMVGDGQYGGGYAPCGRAGSGGGWVAEEVGAQGGPSVPLVPVWGVGQEEQGEMGT